MFEIVSRELIRSSTISHRRHFLQFFIQIQFVQFFPQSKRRKFPNCNEYRQRSSVNDRINFEGTDRFVDETMSSSFDDSLRPIWPLFLSTTLSLSLSLFLLFSLYYLRRFHPLNFAGHRLILSREPWLIENAKSNQRCKAAEN